MNSTVRYDSRQGAFAVKSGNKLVDLEIPANSGVVDLSKTYIALNLSANYTDAVATTIGADTTSGIYADGINFNESQTQADTDADAVTASRNGNKNGNILPTTHAVLVKNASLMSAKKGRIADIKNVAAIRSVLGMYESSQDRIDTPMSSTLQEPPQGEDFSFGPFAECNKENEVSLNKANEIRINIKDIFNFGEIEEYDTGKHGALRLHAQLNLEKMILGTNFDDPQADGVVFNQTITGVVGKKFGEFKNANAGGNDMITLESEALYDDLASCFFYNGMKVKLTQTEGGGFADNVARIIKVELLDTKKIQLTFSGKVAADADAKTDYLVEPRALAAADKSITVNSIELVAEYSGANSGPDGFEYTAYNVIEDNFPVAASLNRNYNLHPNCVNVWITFPNPIYSTEPITSYRLSIDNEPITNRDVVLSGPIHRDLIGKVYMNNGRKLSNMLEMLRVGNASKQTAAITPATGAMGAGAVNISALACPVPLGNGQSRMLGIELNASANLSGKISIYQEIVRKL